MHVRSTSLILIFLSTLSNQGAVYKNSKIWQRCEDGEYVTGMNITYGRNRSVAVQCYILESCLIHENCTLSKTCRQSRLWKANEWHRKIYISGIAPGRKPSNIKLYCCPMHLHRITNCSKIRYNIRDILSIGIDSFYKLEKENNVFRDLKITRNKNGNEGGPSVYRLEAEICSYVNDTYGYCPNEDENGEDEKEEKNEDDKKKNEDEKNNEEENNKKEEQEKRQDEKENKENKQQQNEKKDNNKKENRNQNNNKRNRNNKNSNQEQRANRKTGNKNGNRQVKNQDTDGKVSKRLQRNIDRMKYEQDYVKRKSGGGFGNVGPATGNQLIDCAVGCPPAASAALAIGLFAACYEFSFDHGYVTYSSSSLPIPIGGSATLSCNAGWTLVGPSDISCSEPLNWDPIRSYCDIPCDKVDTQNGEVIYTSENQDQILSGGTATLICDALHLPTQPDISSVSCQLGEWSDNLPTCVKGCSQTVTVYGGTVTYVAPTEEDKDGTDLSLDKGTLTLECKSNYATKMDSATCDSGLWIDEDKLKCEPVCDPNEIQIQNGAIESYNPDQSADPFPDGVVAEGTTVTVKCTNKYYFVNGDEPPPNTVDTMCETSPDWSMETINCVIGCEKTFGTTVTNGEITYDMEDTIAGVVYPGGSAELECDEGSAPDDTGALTATCDNGAWVWPDPAVSTFANCRQMCDKLTVDGGTVEHTKESNDVLTKVESGGSATQTCNSQYYPTTTDTTATCSNGVWSPTLSLCQIGCKQDLIIQNGGVTYSTPTKVDKDGINLSVNSATANLLCETNFGTETDSATCTDGVWSDLQCSKACPIDITLTEASPTYPTTDYQYTNGLAYVGTQVAISCSTDHYYNDGNYDVQNVIITCQDDHQWSIESITCVSVPVVATCIKTTINVQLGEIKYTNEGSSTANPGDTATLQCDVSQGAVADVSTGHQSATCTNGEWVWPDASHEKFADCVKTCNKFSLDATTATVVSYENSYDTTRVLPGTVTVKCVGQRNTFTNGVSYLYVGQDVQSDTFECQNGAWTPFQPTGCIATCSLEDLDSSGATIIPYEPSPNQNIDGTHVIPPSIMKIVCADTHRIVDGDKYLINGYTQCLGTYWEPILDCLEGCDQLTSTIVDATLSHYSLLSNTDPNSKTTPGAIANLMCNPGYSNRMAINATCNEGTWAIPDGWSDLQCTRDKLCYYGEEWLQFDGTDEDVVYFDKYYIFVSADTREECANSCKQNAHCMSSAFMVENGIKSCLIANGFGYCDQTQVTIPSVDLGQEDVRVCWCPDMSTGRRSQLPLWHVDCYNVATYKKALDDLC